MTPRTGTSSLELALTTVVLLLGAAAFGWVFGWATAGALVWVAIAAAVIVPVGVGALLAPRSDRPPRPLVLVLVVQLVAWLLVGSALVVAAGGTVTDFASGLVHSWGSLISFTLPAGDEPTLLVVPITLCWWAAVAATELVVRTRSPLAPALVAGALLVVARLFGSGGPTDPDLGHVLLAAAIVVVGVVLAARRSAAATPIRPSGGDPADRGADRASRVGWVRAAVPVAIVAAAVGAALAVVLPFDRSAATLRTLHDPPPPDDLAVGNPLDALTTDLTTAADEPVLDLTLTVGAVPEGTSMVGGRAPALRLVTLDTFDGVEWSSSARYLRAGTELPAEEGASPTSVEVRQEITLAAADGPWLPAVTWPRSVSVADADADAVLAFAATDGGLVLEGGSAGAGLRYSVVSSVPAVTATELESAGLPASSAFAPAIALPPGMPNGLGAVTTAALGRAATPFQQLVALESWLRSNARLDLDAPGGSSYGAIERFLVPALPGAAGASTAGDVPPGAPVVPTAQAERRVGTPQQFAEAFALMARSRGLPTRLVVGYRTTAASTDGSAAATIRRGDTVVWPESFLAGVGWVPFDPVPALGSAQSVPTPPQIDEVTQAKTDAVARAADPDQSIPPAANPIVEAEAAEGARPWLPVLIALAVLAVVVALVVVIGRPLRIRGRRRRLERSRRTAAGDRLRVLGAWHHTVDALERHGAPSLRSATVGDVAEIASRTWGLPVADPVSALGALVNDTLFEPDDGSAGSRRGDDAWRLADQAVAAAVATPVRVEEPAAVPVG